MDLYACTSGERWALWLAKQSETRFFRFPLVLLVFLPSIVFFAAGRYLPAVFCLADSWTLYASRAEQLYPVLEGNIIPYMAGRLLDVLGIIYAFRGASLILTYWERRTLYGIIRRLCEERGETRLIATPRT